MVNFWAKVKSNTFQVKLLFGQLLETFGLLFNLASGHSALNQPGANLVKKFYSKVIILL